MAHLPASRSGVAALRCCLLRQQFEASAAGIPAVLGCYEHTDVELKYRFIQQAKAMIGRAHRTVSDADVNAKLASCNQVVLLLLDDSRDTIRGFEERLIEEFGFPKYGHAFVAVDYLNRIPAVCGPNFAVSRAGEVNECGCLDLAVHILKNRAGRIQTWKLEFWGEHFYPMLEHEFDNHFHAPAIK